MLEFLNMLVSNWWGILAICVVALAIIVFLSAVLYKVFFKRFYDVVLSGLAILILSPITLYYLF